MKGFTLTELLGVIIVLGVIALITFPIVNNTIKSNKEKLYNSQLEEIKLAAEKWAYANLNILPSNENESITVTLLELKKAGFVSIDSRNPKTGELLPNDMVVTITLKNNNYDIFVDGNSGTDLSNEFNENAPTIILNGNYIEYVEINSSYEEKGAKAVAKDGSEVEVNITYQENGSEIGSIDVTKFSTYTVIYSATSNGYTSKITRTVVVRDTTPPDLNVPDTTELTIEQLESFNLLAGVSAIDNSKEVINIETRGFDRLPTDKIIEYKACDSHNNCTIKRRIIKFVEFTMEPVSFEYTGDEQIFVVPHSGYYKLEAWGAQGGNINGNAYTSAGVLRESNVTYYGGKGAYTTGEIYLTEGTVLYIHVGGTVVTNSSSICNIIGGYNGGISLDDGQCAYGSPGGGATDFRIVSGNWDDFDSIKSRIMVAAGGGGANFRNYGYGEGNGGEGGELIGINGYESMKPESYHRFDFEAGYTIGTGGTQTSDGSGIRYYLNGTIENVISDTYQSGGGGGYYSGGYSAHGGAGGGSSFISGYSGCDAIAENSTNSNIVHTGQPNHYSGYVFDNSRMIAGNKEMPTYDGKSTMVGNIGDGFAKITYIGINN